MGREIVSAMYANGGVSEVGAALDPVSGARDCERFTNAHDYAAGESGNVGGDDEVFSRSSLGREREFQN